MIRHDIIGLHVITDESLMKGRTHLQIAEAAALGGAKVIQYRDKNASGRKMYETALALRELTAKSGVVFIVNDRVDIAAAANADGAHIGQEDVPLEAARRILGNEKIIGVSANSLEEALEAEKGGADYIGLGPIFETATKTDTDAAIGLEGLKKVAAALSIPAIAIGGIKQEHVQPIMRNGAGGIAVISAVVCAKDMVLATREIVNTLNENII